MQRPIVVFLIVGLIGAAWLGGSGAQGQDGTPVDSPAASPLASPVASIAERRIENSTVYDGQTAIALRYYGPSGVRLFGTDSFSLAVRSFVNDAAAVAAVGRAADLTLNETEVIAFRQATGPTVGNASAAFAGVGVDDDGDNYFLAALFVAQDGVLFSWYAYADIGDPVTDLIELAGTWIPVVAVPDEIGDPETLLTLLPGPQDMPVGFVLNSEAATRTEP